jgi:hypothetical protein
MMRALLTILFFQILTVTVCAQSKDTLIIDSNSIQKATAKQILADSLKSKHSPRKATIRSAIIPGWGQAYNKKYWKIPIVYTAIGIPIGTFIYNKKWYEKTGEAAVMLGSTPPDTANYKNRVDEKLYFFFENPGSLPSLLNYRNEFRRNMDYSILFVLVFWGLNVVDATVDGHLKDFDVSDNLSLRVKPVILSGSTTAGVSFVFTIGSKPAKNISSR